MTRLPIHASGSLRRHVPLFKSSALTIGLTAMLLACGGSPSGVHDASPSASADPEAPAATGQSDPRSAQAEQSLDKPSSKSVQPANPYQADFEAASRQYNVPLALLVALGYAETQLQPAGPDEDGTHDADEVAETQPAFGVMALRGDQLASAAALSGQSQDQVRTNDAANIKAAAAWMDDQARQLNINRADVGAWAPVIERHLANPNAEAAASFVAEVYDYVRDGIPADEDAGAEPVLRKAEQAVKPDFPAPIDDMQTVKAAARMGYAGAKWRPAPASNYSNGRSHDVDMLVVHTCAGTYASCWGWLTTPYPQNQYRTSAHYVVNQTGTEVSALVDERNTAHHVGARYMGQPTNPRSVGIEHGGFPYTTRAPWKPGQINLSVKVACDVVKRHGIIRDRNHIIGHYQADPVNRANDPGKAFPWADYMSRVNTCVAGSAGTTDSITIDSNAASNQASVARIVTPSSAWAPSTNVKGYYGTGYFTAKTAEVSDGVNFEFHAAAAGAREVFAWWTSGTDRSAAVPYVIFDASGNRLGTVTRDQRSGGGQWQSLGTYNFSAGWNRITVSRWAAPGDAVVADAIQVR